MPTPTPKPTIPFFCLWTACLLFMLAGCQPDATNQSSGTEEALPAPALQPYAENPAYWSYQGEPVLLLGATDDDNLFQRADMAEQLETLASVGGNYIRNTMSSRDSGNLWPFLPDAQGMYDLNQWNPEYWQKFDAMLQKAQSLGIVVQIEVWDRFDYSRDPWQLNPFNPALNHTYTAEEIGMATEYPKHPSSDLQPFFHSIPGMPRYEPRLDRIRELQEKLVAHMLSYSLKYDNVLYCMNNETSTPVAWGKHWIHFINEQAHAQGKEVYATDMYDHFFKPQSCDRCQDLIAQPDTFEFMDVSQINSRNFGQAHWDTLQYILGLRAQDPAFVRPTNHTKIYGGGNTSWGSGTNDDGVARFCRNILGGSASSRHHRPPAGNGQNEKAQNNIRAFRKLEAYVKFWDMAPAQELLSERAEDEAYLSARPGEAYVLFFPDGGEVQLDLGAAKGELQLRWISLATGDWQGEASQVAGGTSIPLGPPSSGAWLGLLSKPQ